MPEPTPPAGICPSCHAGHETAIHHAECIAPLDQLEGVL